MPICLPESNKQTQHGSWIMIPSSNVEQEICRRPDKNLVIRARYPGKPADPNTNIGHKNLSTIHKTRDHFTRK